MNIFLSVSLHFARENREYQSNRRICTIKTFTSTCSEKKKKFSIKTWNNFSPTEVSNWGEQTLTKLFLGKHVHL